MSTSLQHIIINHDLNSIQDNIQKLFKPKPYPQFELQEFYKHNLYDKHQQFRFFIDILDEWNRKIDKKELSNSSDTLLKKNIFIFNNLRNVIFKNQKYAGDTLNQLYCWFNQTRNSKFKMTEQKEIVNSRQDDDWEIRNTFKSTLPSEIGMYRRRVFWKCEPFGNQRTSFVKPNIGSGLLDLKNRIVRTEVDENITIPVQIKDLKETEEKKIQRIQNQIMRSERQYVEIANLHKKWKKRKNRQDQESVKNFYKKAFSTNKMYFPQKITKYNSLLTKPILEQRAYTSLGGRKQKTPLSFIRYSQSRAVKDDLRQDFFQKKPARKSWLQEYDTNRNRQDVKISTGKLQMIDGAKLLSNPFQTKLKKKSRKN